MNGISSFIVKIDERFKGKITSPDGNVIFLSSIFEDRFQRSKYGEVISNPIEYPGYKINKGEFCWFSHLITNNKVVMGGSSPRTIDSEYLFDPANKLYYVPVSMIYAYTDNGEVVTPDPFLFIRPLKEVNNSAHIKGSMNISDILKSYKKDIEHIGQVVSSNNEMRSLGINDGDIVIFEKDSEYKVDVRGETVYRMRNREIYGKVC